MISFSLSIPTRPENLLGYSESQLKSGVEFDNGIKLVQPEQVIQRLSDTAPWTFFFEVIVPAAIQGAAAGGVGALLRDVLSRLRSSASEGTICIGTQKIAFGGGQLVEITSANVKIPYSASDVSGAIRIKIKDGMVDDVIIGGFNGDQTEA